MKGRIYNIHIYFLKISYLFKYSSFLRIALHFLCLIASFLSNMVLNFDLRKKKNPNKTKQTNKKSNAEKSVDTRKRDIVSVK